jgi:hypothetical protein
MLTISTFFLQSCQEERRNSYMETEKAALATGIRLDTLFFGYYFGMSQKDFFAHSWDLNSKNILKNGTGAEILLHPQGFSKPVSMGFYPEFKEGKISTMPIRFHYDSWSPINPQFSPDSLMPEVIRIMGGWFGLTPKQFMWIKDAQNHRAVCVNVTGNRRIVLFKDDEMYVKVKISDLTAQNEPLSAIK